MIKRAWIPLVLLILTSLATPSFGQIVVPSLDQLHSCRECTGLAEEPVLNRSPREFAVVIGVGDRPGSGAATCVEEALDFVDLLETKFKYPKSSIKLMLFPPARYALRELRRAREKAIGGDRVTVYLCGHGETFSPLEALIFSQQHGYQLIKSEQDDKNEADGRDEYFFFEDAMVKDDYLNEILVRGVAPGVHLSSVLNVCHSGTLLDLPFEYVNGTWRTSWRKLPPYVDVPELLETMITSISPCTDSQWTFLNETTQRSQFTSAFTTAVREGAETFEDLIAELSKKLNETVVLSSFKQFSVKRKLFF